MLYNKITELMEARGITKVELSQKSGVSLTSLHSAIKGDGMRVKTLEAIAKALDVPVGTFFSSDKDDADIPESADVLRERIKARDAVIAEQERLIRVLLADKGLNHRGSNADPTAGAGDGSDPANRQSINSNKDLLL